MLLFISERNNLFRIFINYKGKHFFTTHQKYWVNMVMSLISLFFLSPKLSSSTGQHKGYDIGDEPPCCSLCLPTQFVGLLNICQSIRFSTAKSKLSGRNIKRLLREATKNFHRGEGMRFS